MRTLLRLAAVVLAAASGFAQAQPPAPELVKRVLDRYSRATTASFTETIVTGSVTLKWTVTAEPPDKLRMEMDDTTARLSDFGQDSGGVVIFANGPVQAILFLGNNSFRVSKLATAEASRLTDLLPPFGLSYDLDKSQHLPEETIASAPCYVVELVELKRRNETETYRWWIEKTTENVLQVRRLGGTSESRVTFENLRLNEIIPPETFVFVPSRGSSELK